MTLDQLKAFVTIVRTHSFTRAADALNSSKAHMSRVVTVLEQELGVKLLMRSTRSLALTEIGREVFERAVGILAAVEETERVAHRSLGAPRGMLRLTCGAEFGMLAVSGWIASYCGLYPEVSVEAHFTPRLVDVIHEGFDLAIRIGPLAETRLAARAGERSRQCGLSQQPLPDAEGKGVHRPRCGAVSSARNSGPCAPLLTPVRKVVSAGGTSPWTSFMRQAHSKTRRKAIHEATPRQHVLPEREKGGYHSRSHRAR
jgi:DNA-binding transcriptional LysR family regulator